MKDKLTIEGIITVEEAISLLDDGIHREMTEIFNLNHKAKNYQELADEQYSKMAKIFIEMLPCQARIEDLYKNPEERELIRKLAAMALSIQEQTKEVEE